MNILITGGNSMVAKHLKYNLPNAYYLTSKECDLRNAEQTDKIFATLKPDIVVHLAAKVGGIMDNIKNPVEFFESNVLINTNTLHYAYKHGCKRFIGVLSSCAYPDVLPDKDYPLTIDKIHLGPPAPTNFSYGYAKRCLAVQIDSYNKQFDTNYEYIIPCNLYSEYDHFEGDKAHFVSSLIHKIAYAKAHNESTIKLFGSGKPLRQFMHAGDLASFIEIMIKQDIRGSMNIATNENVSIKNIAEIALAACDAEHVTIEWDSSRPDGQFRKDISDSVLQAKWPFQYTSLRNGIAHTFYHYYNEKYLATK